jgi:hypothetical protein
LFQKKNERIEHEKPQPFYLSSQYSERKMEREKSESEEEEPTHPTKGRFLIEAELKLDANHIETVKLYEKDKGYFFFFL